MVVGVPVPLCQTDYLDTFMKYVVKSVRRLLARRRQAENILPPNDEKQALHTLSYALKLSEAWPDTRELLLIMAPKMEQAGRRDEWMPYLEQGIHQSQQLGDIEAEAELHLQLGILYQLRGKYEQARAHLEASVRGFESLNDPRNQARALNQLAYVARRQRQFEEVTNLVKTALRLLAEEDSERAYSFFVLGGVAFDSRNWHEAADLFEQSASLWEREDNRRMMGISLMSLSTALLPMKAYQEAIVACRKAIALFEEIQDPIHLAITQMNLGNVYLSLEQPLEALGFYLPAERIFHQAQEQLRLGHVNNNIGIAYRQLQQWDKAIAAYLLSIEQYRKVRNIALLVDTMDGLGLAYLGQGQYKTAITTFKDALAQLTQIEGEPNYEHLLEVVTMHLQEVIAY